MTVIIICHKYRQLTRGFLQARLSKHFRDHRESCLRKVSTPVKLENLFQENLIRGILLRDLERSHNIYRSISTPPGNFPLKLSNLQSLHHQRKFGRYCRYSHYEASFLFWICINLTMAGFYTSFVAYSKVGQLDKLPYQCLISWFQDLAKELIDSFEGYASQDTFCKNLFHYRN